MAILEGLLAFALIGALIALHLHFKRKGNVVKVKGDNNTTAGGDIKIAEKSEVKGDDNMTAGGDIMRGVSAERVTAGIAMMGNFDVKASNIGGGAVHTDIKQPLPMIDLSEYRKVVWNIASTDLDSLAEVMRALSKVARELDEARVQHRIHDNARDVATDIRAAAQNADDFLMELYQARNALENRARWDVMAHLPPGLREQTDFPHIDTDEEILQKVRECLKKQLLQRHVAQPPTVGPDGTPHVYIICGAR